MRDWRSVGYHGGAHISYAVRL
ncbi:MAG: hypothetical protein K0Q73_8843, partial [Paenibacillus sp.]|nr:hypothetical protein [Paenibacillus sp.]